MRVLTRLDSFLLITKGNIVFAKGNLGEMLIRKDVLPEPALRARLFLGLVGNPSGNLSVYVH